MTVRFKCQSEYQRSFGVSRSRSVSPQHRSLSSSHVALGRDRRHHGRRFVSVRPTGPNAPADPVGPNPRVQSGTFLRRPPQASVAEAAVRRTSPPAAWRSRSTHRAQARPGPPDGPEPAAKLDAPIEAELPGPAPTNQPPPSISDRLPPSSIEVQPPSSKSGSRSGGQRSGGHRAECLQQSGWKKPAAAASPLLRAEQLLRSASVKENPVTMATEYQRSFQGQAQAPATGPHLHRHLKEQQRIPLFHILSSNIKREEESETHCPEWVRATLPLTHRSPEEGGASTSLQAAALRQQALSYRRRAWGTNFSRNHLSQLRSEHNALWEPSDTTSSPTAVPPDPPTPRSVGGASCVEALDLASLCGSSSRRSSVHRSRMNTPTHAHTHTGAPASGAEEENSDHEDGRLPTPVLRTLPVQRTHHDVTTPATGGAILVGRLRDDASPLKQRCNSGASMARGGATVPPKEAWTENTFHRPSPERHPPSKPIRTERPASSPVVPPPLHGIRGLLRHPDFQHNGELGLRRWEPLCPGGGCGSDEDDRLSVMSWRSAASCSAASAVLERAKKRREDFWGKS